MTGVLEDLCAFITLLERATDLHVRRDESRTSLVDDEGEVPDALADVVALGQRVAIDVLLVCHEIGGDEAVV